MDLKARAQLAVEQACDALSATLSEEELKKVVTIIEAAMRDAVQAATTESSRAASACCEADQDMAHKISREIERTHDSLIANLSSLR